ncbi:MULTISPECIES: AAA family ATPase [unclassified Pseudomonas]|uniref:AAA family ATPase n=1 Tax=unclassified Pseudomonas TaxID=196821 RepID=UPI0009F17969|nr:MULTISPECIES: AAA family ATPase [unclassified Pseudomonas]QOF82718.1 AAA family ATPase [Pseudomonas sp. ADPe]
MQNYLIRVDIEGLWGDGPGVSIPFDRKFNFIIGKNGTGKTTVINLLAAALTGDFERLDKINFSRIFILLGTAGNRRRPSIEVIKEQKPDLPYFDITYKIKMSSSEDPIIYDLDAFAEERSFRGAPQRFVRDRFYREKFIYIQSQLENMIKVNWLSVHRHVESERVGEDRRPINAVDQKLALMNNQLVRYFSRLGTSFAEETKNFQKSSFLSLTSIQKEANIRSFVESVDVENEKRSLASIFELLGVEQTKATRQVERISQELVKAKTPFLKNEGISLQQLLAVFNSFKTHALVQSYESLQEKKEAIFQPINKFIDVVNSLFSPQKKVEISPQNELIVRSRTGLKIEIEDLSSGEKQLLIILGQALLQESGQVVYIADEPELSLHIDWQERLTTSISKLNPNAQIVFATHSPDIVGEHPDNVMDMEALLV